MKREKLATLDARICQRNEVEPASSYSSLSLHMIINIVFHCSIHPLVLRYCSVFDQTLEKENAVIAVSYKSASQMLRGKHMRTYCPLVRMYFTALFKLKCGWLIYVQKAQELKY